MKRTLIFACIFGLLFISCSYAEDAYTKPFSGGVFLGGRAINLDNQSAKFNEYNGIVPGVFGGADFQYDKDAYHLNAEGAYLGDDDLYVKFKGGKWGMFKYSLYYTEFPHNLSFKDKSIYNTPGSEFQTFNGTTTAAGPTNINPNTWASQAFDYKVKRKDLGGSFDFWSGSPFFFSVDANRLERQGQTPWAATSGQAGFKTVEFALPVDNNTINTNAQVGWRNKQFFAAFSGGFSKFTNDSEFTRFRDAFVATAATPSQAQSFGTAVGAPDNKSWNIRFTGTARKLPLNSVFAVDAGYQRNTSETTILNSIDAANSATPAAPIVQSLIVNRGTFHGDVEYWNVGANLTSNPIKNLTTKLYYKYVDKKNNNDAVTFSTTQIDPTTGRPFVPIGSEIFSYQKTTVGADGSYRFMNNLKAILGYEFTDLKRRITEFEAGESAVEEGTVGFHGNEANLPDTWDHKYTGQLVYNPFDWLGARFKYQKLYRNASFVTQAANPLNVADANTVLENNLRRFDIGNKDQDMIRFTADIMPMETLNIALEYAYKEDRFRKNALGLQWQNQNEFIIDASFDWRGIKFFGFFDWDASTTKQTQKFVNVTTPTLASTNPNFPNPDPGAPANVNSFLWDAKLDNNNYAYGFGATVPLVKNRLQFMVQYDFEKNNGTADFTSAAFVASQTALGINNGNIGIPAWDDYTRQTLSARLKYDYNKDVAFVLGYLYSQFRLNDGQLNGYKFVVPGANTLLSGAYTDQSYNANVYYLKAIYRF